MRVKSNMITEQSPQVGEVWSFNGIPEETRIEKVIIKDTGAGNLGTMVIMGDGSERLYPLDYFYIF